DRDRREDEDPRGRDLLLEECRDDRREHARRGDAVSHLRGRRTRETLQSVDERDGGDEIDPRDQLAKLFHYFFSAGFAGRGRALNICSIRSVTTKPPTTLIVPSTTARKRSEEHT